MASLLLHVADVLLATAEWDSVLQLLTTAEWESVGHVLKLLTTAEWDSVLQLLTTAGNSAPY